MLAELMVEAEGVNDGEALALLARERFDTVDETGEVGAGGEAVMRLDAQREADLQGGMMFGRVGTVMVAEGDAGGDGRGDGVMGLAETEPPSDMQDIRGEGFGEAGETAVVVQIDRDVIGGGWHGYSLGW